VIVFHALFDFLSVAKAGGGSVAAIMRAVVMIGAVRVVIVFKPANLSRATKQTDRIFPRRFAQAAQPRQPAGAPKRNPWAPELAGVERAEIYPGDAAGPEECTCARL
jgi:hypothetical protein